jgi:hypothetical protein
MQVPQIVPYKIAYGLIGLELPRRHLDPVQHGGDGLTVCTRTTQAPHVIEVK